MGITRNSWQNIRTGIHFHRSNREQQQIPSVASYADQAKKRTVSTCKSPPPTVADINAYSEHFWCAFFSNCCILHLNIHHNISWYETGKEDHMTLILEAMLMSMGMIVLFFLSFLVLYILALTLAPIERGLSNYIWTHTTPPPKTPVPTGSFRDFSKKYWFIKLASNK